MQVSDAKRATLSEIGHEPGHKAHKEVVAVADQIRFLTEDEKARLFKWRRRLKTSTGMTRGAMPHPGLCLMRHRRHTFASRLVMAGVDLYAVKVLLGHNSIEMTERYAHLDPNYLKQAIGALVSRQQVTPELTPPNIFA